MKYILSFSFILFSVVGFSQETTNKKASEPKSTVSDTNNTKLDINKNVKTETISVQKSRAKVSKEDKNSNAKGVLVNLLDQPIVEPKNEIITNK